jgi:hypothetical protein
LPIFHATAGRRCACSLTENLYACFCAIWDCTISILSSRWPYFGAKIRGTSRLLPVWGACFRATRRQAGLDDTPGKPKVPTRRLAAAAQAREIPLGVLGMGSTSARACLTPQEQRGPRSRRGPPTAETGSTSPQTAKSATTTRMLRDAVNINNIFPNFSTGRLAQGRPRARIWNHTCAKRLRQKTTKAA